MTGKERGEEKRIAGKVERQNKEGGGEKRDRESEK